MGDVIWIRNRGQNECLFDMLPVVSVDDGTNVRLAHTKLRGDDAPNDAALCQSAYLANVFSGQLSKILTLANNRRGPVPFLQQHVCAVVLRRAEKQVARIHAASVVAGMKDEYSGWDLSMVEFPRIAMGAHQSASTAMELPVAVVCDRTIPHPTPIVHGRYSRPEYVDGSTRERHKRHTHKEDSTKWVM